MKYLFLALLLVGCATEPIDSVIEKAESGSTNYTQEELEYLQEFTQKVMNNEELTDKEKILFYEMFNTGIGSTEDWVPEEHSNKNQDDS